MYTTLSQSKTAKQTEGEGQHKQNQRTPTQVSTAAVQAAWRSADTQLPPLTLESLNNGAFCGLVSSAGGSESLHIFVCAVTNGVTHSPIWGIWGLVLFYLQLQKKNISYYRGDNNNTAKSYKPPPHVPGCWEECRPQVIAKGSWGWGLWAQVGPSLTYSW